MSDFFSLLKVMLLSYLFMHYLFIAFIFIVFIDLKFILHSLLLSSPSTYFCHFGTGFLHVGLAALEYDLETRLASNLNLPSSDSKVLELKKCSTPSHYLFFFIGSIGSVKGWF